MLAEHDEAHGQRRRHAAGRAAPTATSRTPRTPATPPARPRRRPAYSDGFEHEIGEQFEDDEQADHAERTGPALEGRQADEDRRACAEHGPDVRDESQRRTERRPDQGVGHAEDVEPDADGDAVDQIDQRLHQQLPADAGSGLVKRLRGDGQLAVPDQPDQPVAQIAAFEQHEDDHRHHEPRGSQRADDRREPREARETVACAEVTTTGRETVPLGASDRPRSVLMSSIVSCSFSTELPLPAPRTSAIFARILAR